MRFVDELTKSELDGKIVLVRVDFNVPLKKVGKEYEVTDETRIKGALPTIRHILGCGGRVVLCSHLGRPKGKFEAEFSMMPVGETLAKLLDHEVIVPIDFGINDYDKLIKANPHKSIFLLENIRFESGEEKNSPELAKKLANLADFYVNDAFGASHRAHASVVAITELFKDRKFAGLLVKKEVEFLKQVLNPPKPFCLLSGGAKVSDKIKSFEFILEKTNILLIGGAMAYTFLRAEGQNVGLSKMEKDFVQTARAILKRAKEKNIKVVLPVDHIVANPLNFEEVEVVDQIPDNKAAFDIGPKTIELFKSNIKECATIFWNGPLGFFEKKEFSNGTKQIAKAVAESNATSIIGGGDTAAAVHETEYANKMSHISTGGGASLEFIENNGRLVALEALKK